MRICACSIDDEYTFAVVGGASGWGAWVRTCVFVVCIGDKINCLIVVPFFHTNVHKLHILYAIAAITVVLAKNHFACATAVAAATAAVQSFQTIFYISFICYVLCGVVFFFFFFIIPVYIKFGNHFTAPNLEKVAHIHHIL